MKYSEVDTIIQHSVSKNHVLISTNSGLKDGFIIKFGSNYFTVCKIPNRVPFPFTGCKIDILKYMDTKCSGRITCEVKVSAIVDDIPDRSQPCPKDLRNYLEASYTCIKGGHSN